MSLDVAKARNELDAVVAAGAPLLSLRQDESKLGVIAVSCILAVGYIFKSCP
jgi:hypothetical protein